MSSWIYGVQNVEQKVPPPHNQIRDQLTSGGFLPYYLMYTLQVTDRIQGDRRTEMICLLFWVNREFDRNLSCGRGWVGPALCFDGADQVVGSTMVDK